MGQTISCSKGRVALKHDDREHKPENADVKMEKYNTYIKKCDDLHIAFNNIFKESVDEYNSKQKRSDRKVKDYYEDITKSDRKENPCYEYVFQIGNKFDNPVSVDEQGRSYWHPVFELDEEGKPHRTGFERREGKRFWGKDAKKSEEILKEFAIEFEEKFPNFKVVSSTIHMDEQTPHLHVAFVPVASGYKQKMNTRCSLTKALEQMGFDNSNAKNLAITQWKHKCEGIIEEKMKSRNMERKYGDGRTTRYDIQTYKATTSMAEYEAERRIDQAIDTARLKSDEIIGGARKEKEELENTISSLTVQKENVATEIQQRVESAKIFFGDPDEIENKVKVAKQRLSNINIQIEENADVIQKQEIQIKENKGVLATIKETFNEWLRKIEKLKEEYKKLKEAPPEVKVIEKVVEIPKYVEVEKVVKNVVEVPKYVEMNVDYKDMAEKSLDAFDTLVNWLDSKYNCMNDMYAELGAESENFLRTWKTVYPRCFARVAPLAPDGEEPIVSRGKHL